MYNLKNDYREITKFLLNGENSIQVDYLQFSKEKKPNSVINDNKYAIACLQNFVSAKKKPTNVSQVKQLSPFRYPGGKSWLVPEICHFVINLPQKPSLFIEPFAGGAIAGLTAANSSLSNHVILGEIDEDVAAVWEIIFNGSQNEIDSLCRAILNFEISLENIQSILETLPENSVNRAFRTIVKNRVQRGGIMAQGAGFIKRGEGDKGINSRWYPETLARRINLLHSYKEKISFTKCDGFDLIQKYSAIQNAFFFIDPPYTAGKKNAGKRLYNYNQLDHERLFYIVSGLAGTAMMTYDDDPYILNLARIYGMHVQKVAMKNSHHAILYELMVIKA
ncbi:MAG: DNA adenine methylase [Alphaproteobacteria bacterium]|nr:DNA adenine methylase [Alphaproteobacteria bacterium]